VFDREELLKLPISYFSMPMGVLGVGLEVQHLEKMLEISHFFGEVIVYFSWALVGAMLCYFLFNQLSEKGRSHTLSQWRDPLSLLDFPILSLTALLVLMTLSDFRQDVHHWVYIFYLVMLVHTWLNIEILTRWFNDVSLDILKIKPTLFIMLSGNFMVVIVGYVYLPAGDMEFLWFYFSVSLFLWFSFVFMLFYRLIFEQVIQPHLRPSLFIVLSPPSLGLVAYSLLSGASHLAPLIWVLFSFATFILFMWFFMYPYFRNIKLSMIGWAFIYPLASYDVSLQFMYQLTEQFSLLLLAMVVMTVNIVLSILLSLKMGKTIWLNVIRH